MLEILYFAIVSQNEDMIISLLKAIPREILFFDKPSGDYLVSLLKHYNCRRAFDYLRSSAPQEVKASAEFEIKDSALPAEKIQSTFDKMWDEICSLSRQKASFEEFKKQFAQYDSLLTIATDYPVLHCMRAASVAYLLQDYAAATRHFETAITHLLNAGQSKSQGYIPATLVDEMLTELTFRVFAAFSVKPSEAYLNLLKNNLYQTNVAFCIGQEAFLFPLSATCNLETLRSMHVSLGEFFKFKRQLKITKLEYQDMPDYKKCVKIKLFVIRRFYEWLLSLEKQNNLTITFQSQKKLNELLLGMKKARLELFFAFYGFKKLMLDIFRQCYRMMGVEAECPFKAEFDAAAAIEKTASERMNDLTTGRLIAYVGPEKNVEEQMDSKQTRKQRKKDINKEEKKSSAPPSAPSESERPLESYAELPTYYPDVTRLDLPGNTRLQKKQPSLFLACPEAKSGLKEQEILTKPSVAEWLLTNPPPSNFIVRKASQTNSSQLFTPIYYVDFVDPINKDSFFYTHPEYYLEAVYLVSKYHFISASVQVALDLAKTHIADSLYQIHDYVLRAQYDIFLRHFGKVAASQIFINYGVFKTLIDRGIFPIAETQTKSAEKYVAPALFRS